jgi:uncharacterized protein (TIGR02145 family)
MKKAATILALLCITACDQQKDTFTDTRDGKKYKTTKIGEQVWMENLNYEAEGSRCYNDSISYCKKYGRLYNLAMAMKACPKGWHLPSDEEWDELIDFTGGKDVAGKKLKSKSGWNDHLDDRGRKITTSTDEFGFSALPGGGGGSGGDFYGVGDIGYWWSSSEYGSDYAYFRYMHYYNEFVNYNDLNKSYLFSVRCVQD